MGDQLTDENHWKTDKGAALAQLLPQNNSKTDQGEQEEAQLPQDLITEILLCFPVKSLLHFRCVSKSFCTIIDSEQFIYLHQNGYEENKKQRKLILQYNKETKLARSLHVYDVDTGFQDKIKEPFLESDLLPCGYCNGLILLFVDSSKLALWNPTTHQYRNLPCFPIKEASKGSHWSRMKMGLGYDSTRNDYKVVLIVGTKTNNDVHDLQVWIFGLKSNSWRMSSPDFPYREDKVEYFGHFANGSLYWLRSPRGGEYAVVAFDVAKETISEVSLPFLPSKCCQRDLHVLDGCLCMSFFLSIVPHEVSFYVKKEVGTEFEWRKLFSLTPKLASFSFITRSRILRVLGYSKEGDKILMDLGLNVIVLYDLKRSFLSTENRKLVDVDPNGLWGYPFLCVESLASVGGGNFL